MVFSLELDIKVSEEGAVVKTKRFLDTVETSQDTLFSMENVTEGV